MEPVNCATECDTLKKDKKVAFVGLVKRGIPRSIAKRLVGHRSDSMYARYAITTEDDLRAAVRQLHTPEPVQ